MAHYQSAKKVSQAIDEIEREHMEFTPDGPNVHELEDGLEVKVRTGNNGTAVFSVESVAAGAVSSSMTVEKDGVELEIEVVCSERGKYTNPAEVSCADAPAQTDQVMDVEVIPP